MSIESSAVGALRGASRGDAAIRPRIAWLRILVITAGISASVLFVIVGLSYELQMYADGSIFSYAVAVQDAWAFHWHNISGRMFVYLFCYLPAETYVGLTGDARGGIDIYGLLFFGSQAMGLAATYATDRSKGRIIFCTACVSVACLCPLVFGYPTEMWMAHALFWPTLAICHYAHRGVGGTATVVAALTALIFTHEGAVVFAVAIMATLLLRGTQDAALRRAAAALLGVMAIWALVKTSLRPDANFSSILVSVALNSIDINNFTCGLFKLLLVTFAAYGGTYFTLRRLISANARVVAAALVAAALSAYWLWFDHTLHADNRYYLRTALLIATPMLGAFAAFRAVEADGRLNFPLPFMQRIKALMAHDLRGRGPAAGALFLVLLVHVVETSKFVTVWTSYKSAVQTLAMSSDSNPALGDARFVSATRIGSALDRLSWPSTTPYLSVLVAPAFTPKRLVVDPRANYFWTSCETAIASELADRAIPADSRLLIRTHACLRR
jgi:hypothetical protein